MTALAPRVRRRGRRQGPRRVSVLGQLGVLLTMLFIALAVVGPWVGVDPLARTGGPLEPPSAEHWFGTDNLGRDLFARTSAGARLSLFVAVCSVLVGLLVAVPLGLLAGFFGGRWVDDIIMRVMEAIQALPVFVFALFVLGMLGSGPSEIGPITLSPATKVVLLLALSFLPYFARVTRAATLVEVQEEYVDALRVVGVSRWRIVLVELLPNAMPPVLVQAFLWVGIAIFSESALSFLGLGINPPDPSLGNILSDATSYLMLGAWWFSVIPGLAILLVTIGINLAGDEVDRLLGRRR
ncbi:ABC transporter permease [Ornithinimicrobium faecis]|uniref:ABC transporter permease n=1 Tax=Ornithinimicrobium faecis TaxID=2934158 RepID=UPI0021181D5B|nr:ABC transporter permease [Ornithinimicrobium sp. HY1745]